MKHYPIDDNSVIRVVEGEGSWDIELDPRYWFIHNGYLNAQVASFLMTAYVGDVKYDNSKPLKVRIEVPLVEPASV